MVDCRFYPQLLGLLCSQSSLAVFLSFSSCLLMPPLPLSVFLFSISHSYPQSFTNTFLLSLTPCLVLSLFLLFSLSPSFSLSCPLLQPVKKSVLQQSSPAAADCLYMATSYLMRQVGGGGMQLISLPRSLSWLILSILFIVCMCVCLCVCMREREGESVSACMCMCAPEAMMIHQTRTLSGHNHFPLSHCF